LAVLDSNGSAVPRVDATLSVRRLGTSDKNILEVDVDTIACQGEVAVDNGKTRVLRLTKNIL
jgi:hypothetical protein